MGLLAVVYPEVLSEKLQILFAGDAEKLEEALYQVDKGSLRLFTTADIAKPTAPPEAVALKDLTVEGDMKTPRDAEEILDAIRNLIKERAAYSAIKSTHTQVMDLIAQTWVEAHGFVYEGQRLIGPEKDGPKRFNLMEYINPPRTDFSWTGLEGTGGPT